MEKDLSLARSAQVRLARLLALQADPVADAFLPRAEGGWNHRHAASGTDRRALVIHDWSIATDAAGGDGGQCGLK
ncbi:MAG: hypothetical protein QOD43_1502 [Gaiellaceae bacterium]|nr:hypothetical protein [Gaiellaceae bacterium]